MSSDQRPDYEILRERLEAEGFTFDSDEGGVHCNWFWAQLGGTAPNGRTFYYRWKHGYVSFHWTDVDDDILREPPDAEEEPGEDPSAAGAYASLHRMIAAS